MDDNKIEIEQNVNQEQEQQQEQAQPITPLPTPEPAEQEQAQPGQEQEQGGEDEHAKPEEAQGQDTGLPSDSEPAETVAPGAPDETEAPAEITFAISPELAAKFQERADEGEALESLQRAFIDEVVKRVSASRAESRKIWEEVFAVAGRSEVEYTGTLDPATNVVTFTPVETVEEAKPGFGTLLKKLFAA